MNTPMPRQQNLKLSVKVFSDTKMDLKILIDEELTLYTCKFLFKKKKIQLGKLNFSRIGIILSAKSTQLRHKKKFPTKTTCKSFITNF